MKIAAIYCVWLDDIELLRHSINNIRPVVDEVIIVYSEKSNYGEGSRWVPFVDANIKVNYEPNLNLPAQTNETTKRNIGIQKARELGFTHFVMMDADEFYDQNEFEEAKRTIDLKHGLVCRSKVYFREPTLTIGYDTTLVPFIHKLTPNIKCTFNREYPFAWTSEDGKPFTNKKQIRIDPTRSYNLNTGVFWSDVTMHHMSWVRSDVRRKIRNSTAKHNIERSSIVQDYLNAKPGYFCQFYNKELTSCPNVFGIPRIIDDYVGKEHPI